MAKAKTAKRKDEVAIGMGGGPYPLVPLPGARNIRTLSGELNRRKIASATGGKWHPVTVIRLRERLNNEGKEKAIMSKASEAPFRKS